jgi:hypothetical protein
MWKEYIDYNLNRCKDASEFLQNNFGANQSEITWSEEYFYWKLSDKNISGRGYLAICEVDGKIVGTASVTKKYALINNKKVSIVEIGDTYTLPSMRRERPESLSKYNSDPKNFVNKSMFGRMVEDLVMQVKKDGDFLVYGTPNKNSYPGYIKRMNFKEYMPYKNHSYTRPKFRQIVKYYPFLKKLEFIVNKIDNVYVSSLRVIYKIKNFNIIVKRGEEVPEGMQVLWSKVALLKKSFSLVRGLEYWKYRYENHPLHNYLFHSYFDNGTLMAVSVTRIMTLADGRRTVVIVEWMCCSSLNLSYIINDVVHFYRNSDMDAFLLWGNGINLIDFKKNLFIKRKIIPIIFHDSLGTQTPELYYDFDFYMGTSDAI